MPSWGQLIDSSRHSSAHGAQPIAPRMLPGEKTHKYQYVIKVMLTPTLLHRRLPHSPRRPCFFSILNLFTKFYHKYALFCLILRNKLLSRCYYYCRRSYTSLHQFRWRWCLCWARWVWSELGGNSHVADVPRFRQSWPVQCASWAAPDWPHRMGPGRPVWSNETHTLRLSWCEAMMLINVTWFFYPNLKGYSRTSFSFDISNLLASRATLMDTFTQLTDRCCRHVKWAICIY